MYLLSPMLSQNFMLTGKSISQHCLAPHRSKFPENLQAKCWIHSTHIVRNLLVKHHKIQFFDPLFQELWSNERQIFNIWHATEFRILLNIMVKWWKPWLNVILSVNLARNVWEVLRILLVSYLKVFATVQRSVRLTLILYREHECLDVAASKVQTLDQSKDWSLVSNWNTCGAKMMTQNVISWLCNVRRLSTVQEAPKHLNRVCHTVSSAGHTL